MALIYMGSAILAAISVWCAWNAFTSRSPKIPTALFFALICVSLFLLRWRQITWQHEFNPDESQMLAQGLRYLSHPVPWRDVDGGTGGPLDSMIFSVPILFGAPPTWALARVTMLCLNLLTLIFVYLALRCFGTRSDSQFGLMPGVVFYGFILDQEYTHYSSEALPVALLAAALFLLAKEWTAGNSSRIRLFLLGTICGALPFTKLQSSPLAIFSAVIMVAIILDRSAMGLKQEKAWTKFAIFCCGGFVVPVVLLVPVALCGALGDFWKCYILSNASYVGKEGFQQKSKSLRMVLLDKEDFQRFFQIPLCAAAFALALAWAATRKKPANPLSWAIIVVLANCLLTLACIFTAGKPFYHYGLFIVPAFTFLFGITFIAAKSMLAGTADSQFRIAFARAVLLAGSCVALWVLQLHNTYYFVHKNRHLNNLTSYYGNPGSSFVSEQVKKVKEPGDTMGIWGWMSGYYLETGMPPATRTVNIACLVEPMPLNGYYRSNYMADLEQSRPPVFIDAIGGNQFEFNWTNAPNHEVLSKLDKYVQDHYSLWLNVYMTNRLSVGMPIRVYVANDRVAQLHLKHEEIYTKADPFYPSPSEHAKRQLVSAQ